MKDQRTGFGSIRTEGDPYSFYLGKWAEFSSPHDKSMGIYRGIEEGNIRLQPHIIAEGFSYAEGKQRTLYFLSEAPEIISIGMPLIVKAVRQELIESMLNNKRIVLPSP